MPQTFWSDAYTRCLLLQRALTVINSLLQCTGGGNKPRRVQMQYIFFPHAIQTSGLRNDVPFNNTPTQGTHAAQQGLAAYSHLSMMLPSHSAIQRQNGTVCTWRNKTSCPRDSKCTMQTNTEDSTHEFAAVMRSGAIAISSEATIKGEIRQKNTYGKRSWSVLELLLQGLDMVRVDVRVAHGQDQVSRDQPAHLPAHNAAASGTFPALALDSQC